MQFSGSRAISDAMASLKERFGPLIGIWLVFFVIQIGSLFLFATMGGLSQLGGMGAAPDFSGGMIVGVLAFYLLTYYLGGASWAAMSAAASPISKAKLGDALATGFKGGVTILGIIILLVIAGIAVGIVFGLVMGVIGAVAGASASGILGAILGLGGMAYLGTKVSLIAPVVAVDGVSNPITAIAKSWKMTKGSTLKMFLVYLAFIVAAVILTVLLFVPVIGAFSGVMSGQAPDIDALMGSMAYIAVAYIVLSVLLSLAFAALVAAMHSQLSPDTGANLSEAFA